MIRYRIAMQRIIVACTVLACMTAYIVFLLIQVSAQERIIKTLQADAIGYEIRITNLAQEVERMKNVVDVINSENAISRGSERTATITAYTHTGNPTASGVMPIDGVTVAGPRNVPFGTVVWIDGIGERVVQDRTHIRLDGRYDVFMDSESDCLEWGIQERVVHTER